MLWMEQLTCQESAMCQHYTLIYFSTKDCSWNSLPDTHIRNIFCTSLPYCWNDEKNSWLQEHVHHSTPLESQHCFRISVNYRSNGDSKRPVWGKELTPCHSKGSGYMISIIQEWLIATCLYCIVTLTGKNVSNLNLNGAIWFTSSLLCPQPEVT